ncbi:FAD-dependent oxidoreductase [Desertimonas flava]|uniref:FAD-dependent oxidoreductase n=1 Tax=Desertimonas flava TaxID=2064846 RepID=UPI000E355AED|nr:FAD-dependent oxidoreductase [Desertimonas flava]
MDEARVAATFDVIVLGTGAAGLTAALAAAHAGASVGLFEKSDRVGGASAWSGGMVWIPCNPHMEAIGADDSREEALRYLDSLSHGMIDPALAAAYVDTGPEMVSWLEADTPVEFTPCVGFPDYHPEHPGGRPHGGRSLECLLYPFDELGPWADQVTVGRQMPETHLRMGETPLGSPTLTPVPPAEMQRRREHDERGLGQSLVGRLLRGCLDRGVEPVVATRATRLITEGDDVVGVRVEGPAGPRDLGARGGVVLATGGFEWADDLVKAFLRGPLERAVSVPTNTGDGLRMAMRVGAALGNMREAWWVPTVDVPDPDEPETTFPYLIMSQRTRPRLIMVNRQGRRFSNEAANYNASGAAFHDFDPTTFDYANLPAWLVFDQEHLDRYGFANVRPGGGVPFGAESADTLAELGRRLGMPDGALDTTVRRWNEFSAAGCDPDFGRGASAHDNWWGDPAFKGTPQATLGPIDTAPFHAVRVRPGALGTKGGPRTDASAQVLDVDGAPIRGLYAAGNVMASAMGMTYGGGGGTLGPGMVFGYLAGRAAAAAAA